MLGWKHWDCKVLTTSLLSISHSAGTLLHIDMAEISWILVRSSIMATEVHPLEMCVSLLSCDHFGREGVKGSDRGTTESC